MYEINEERTRATRCEVLIEGKSVEAIVDTGAGPSVITDGLRRELEILIECGSNTIFNIANGRKVASLGKAEINVELDEGLIIPIKVEIIDSDKKDLILGTDLLKYGIIDLKEGILTMKIEGEEYEIPINFRKRNIEEESSEEEDENKEGKYENESENDNEYESEDDQEIYEEEQMYEELAEEHYMEEYHMSESENEKELKA